MQQSPLGRASRTINMNELGHALTQLGNPQGAPRPASGTGDPTTSDTPPIKALFVYNCNAAAVAPDSDTVLAGLRRPDLFTIVHEQFFTDTTDYADLIFPATTFLEAKDVMGAYGHLFAQINSPAIAPLGESRSNVHLFAALGQRLFPSEPAFLDTEDDLIAQSLDVSPVTLQPTPNQHPWFVGITPETLVAAGQIPLQLPTNADGNILPFSTPDWFRTPSGRGQLTPVPVFTPPTESRSGQAATPDFPLEFLPRKADNFMNTTFANLPTPQHHERRTSGILEIHPTDAAARNLLTGDPVTVFNPRGRITLTASVAATVAPGVVAARLDWHKLSTGGANVNTLTSQRLTDIGGGATFFSTLVQVEKLPTPSNPPLAAN
jgi:anaerobic selenocysteine-containing dehydrogenase